MLTINAAFAVLIYAVAALILIPVVLVVFMLAWMVLLFFLSMIGVI